MLVGVLLIKGYFCPVFLNYVVMPRKCLVTVQLVGRGISLIAMILESWPILINHLSMKFHL